MKTLIAAAVLVVSSAAFATTSNEWGVDEWADYCSGSFPEYLDDEASKERVINDAFDTLRENEDYIDANMLWADDNEFHRKY